MNDRQVMCDPERIELFLTRQLEDHELAAFELHLDDCDVCRRQLESTAAGDDIWSGVRDSLQGQAEHLGTACPESSTEASDAPMFAHAVVLDLLAPTDDDRMLGRLGSYEVAGVVGTGGMGVVLKAFDQSLNRYVAIKILTPHLGSSGSARRRFSREAQAAAAVVHDNVIEIHGVAETNGLPYLVMPYVKGPSLQKRIDDNGPLALSEILRIGMQASAGLAAAHAQGLVHRDVKPANILLADGVERVKLTDFGLARAADDASLTRTGIIAGTPQYMSPEQARGDSIDQRSDLFSLGSVLYAMCTGRGPFRAETSYGVLRRVTDEEPKSIREIYPDIPEWLCRIIAKLMSKQPYDRFESASEVGDLLEECLAHVQQPTVVPLPDTLVPESRSRFFSGSRRTVIVAMIVAFSFGLLGMVAWQATAPPDIAGMWTGDAGWGQVELLETGPGTYSGSYTDTFGKKSGKLQFEWSRIERRFKGTWDEGADRYGTISIRLVDDEIRGGCATNQGSRIDPGNPELADLIWIRKADFDDRLGTPRQDAIPTADTDALPPADEVNYDRFPKELRHRLTALPEGFGLPPDAKFEEFSDRYEISASPWHTGVPFAGGKSWVPILGLPEKYESVREWFGDEGKLTVFKADDYRSSIELIGRARVRLEQIRFSAQRIVQEIDLFGAHSTTLSGGAHCSDDRVELTADRMIYESRNTLLEGSAKLRRKTAGGKPEIVLADRLVIDHDTERVRVGAEPDETSTGVVGPVDISRFYVSPEQLQRIDIFIKDARNTTYYPSELCEFTPGSRSPRRLRDDVVSLHVMAAGSPDQNVHPLMEVLHLPGQRVFYIQRDVAEAKTPHYYGPFYGEPVFKLGLSSKKDGAPKTDSESDVAKTSVPAGSILIHVIDQTGHPIEDAVVSRNHAYSVEGQKRHRFENAEFHTDASGTTSVGLSGLPWDLRLRVRKEGFVPLHAMWAAEFGPIGAVSAEVPREFTFQMERGTEIGGIVVDQWGTPVAGVAVEVLCERADYGDPGGFMYLPVGVNRLAENDDVVTDADGRWSLNNVPSNKSILRERGRITYTPTIRQMKSEPLIKIRLSHPDCEHNTWGRLQRNQDITLDSLRTKSARIVMRRKPASP